MGIKSFKIPIILIFAVIIGRVYQLQTKGGEKYRKQGEKQYTSLSFIK